MTDHLTIADLLSQGDTCTVEQAAACLECSRGSAYAAVRAGEIPAIHLGSRWLIPTRRLAALLGVDLEETA